MTFPLPSGPMAYVILALLIAGFLMLAYVAYRDHVARKYVERKHEGYQSVVDRLRRSGGV